MHLQFATFFKWGAVDCSGTTLEEKARDSEECRLLDVSGSVYSARHQETALSYLVFLGSHSSSCGKVHTVTQQPSRLALPPCQLFSVQAFISQDLAL